MKKIIIMCAFVISGFALSQQNSDNSYLYKESYSHAEEDAFPGNPGDPNPVPIDQYIPLLMIIAMSMVVVITKHKKEIDSV